MNSASQLLNSATSHIVLLLILLPVIGAVLLHLARRADNTSLYSLALTNVWTGQFLTVVMLVLVTTGSLTVDTDHARGDQLVSSILWHTDASPSTGNVPPAARRDTPTVHGPPVRILTGVGGISVWLMALTVAVSVALVQSQPREHERLGSRLFWILLTESALLGSIAALDIILFSFTSVLSVIGISLLVAETGDRTRLQAARRFFIVQLTSGVLLTTGLIGIAISHWWMQVNEQTQYPELTFSMTTVVAQIPHLAEFSQPARDFWSTLAPWLFLITGCGLLLRLPIPPLHHNWLRVAEHADCRIAAFVTAGYLPVTVHLLLRVLLPLFPEHSAAIAGQMVCWAAVGSFFLSLVATATASRQRRLATVALSGTTAVFGACFLQQAVIIQGAALTTVALAAAGALSILCGNGDGKHEASRQRASPGFHISTAITRSVPIAGLAGLSLLPLTAGFWGILLVLEGLFSFSPGVALLVLASFGLSGRTLLLERFSNRAGQLGPVASRPGTGSLNNCRLSVSTFIPLTAIFVAISLCPGLVLDQLPAPDTEHMTVHPEAGHPQTGLRRSPGTLAMPLRVKRITAAE